MIKKYILPLTLLLSIFLVACGGQEAAPVVEEAVEAVVESADSAVETVSEVVEEAEAMAEEMTSDEEMMEASHVSYTISADESTVSWRGAKAAGSDHTGTVGLQEGSLVVADGALVSGSFLLDMTSMVSTDGAPARLLNHLKSDDFFSVDTHPTATLEINAATDNGDGTFAVSGQLTIKGITHPIEFVATASEADGTVTASADIVFDRALYDVRYGSGSFFDDLGNDLINDEVEISVELVGSA